MRSDDRALIGQVIWAAVSNAIEAPDNTGKLRPVVRAHTRGGHWECIGLTTRAVALDGRVRVAIPGWAEAGLHGPGYLWGYRLVRVATIDFGSHIGWIDREFARAIINHVYLPRHVAVGLWNAACEAEDVPVTLAPHRLVA